MAVYPVTWGATALAFIAYYRLGKWRRAIYVPDRVLAAASQDEGRA